MHYDYIRRHQSLRMTPAMKAGVERRIWSLEDIVALVEGDRVGGGTMEAIDLGGLHTRVLLKYLQTARERGHDFWSENWTAPRGFCYQDALQYPDHLYVESAGRIIPVIAIKAELAKREHIPNRQEAEETRRESIRTANNRRKKGGYRAPLKPGPSR